MLSVSGVVQVPAFEVFDDRRLDPAPDQLRHVFALRSSQNQRAKLGLARCAVDRGLPVFTVVAPDGDDPMHLPAHLLHSLAQRIAFVGWTRPRLHGRVEHPSHALAPTADRTQLAKHIAQVVQLGSILLGRAGQMDQRQRVDPVSGAGALCLCGSR